MQQYVWMEIGIKGKIKSTTLLTLESNGDVYFDTQGAVKGQWHYYFQEEDISFFTIEFSGNGRGPWKRHVMAQSDDNKFRLLDKDDWHYNGDTNLWTKRSVQHENKKAVAMLRTNGKEFIAG